MNRSTRDILHEKYPVLQTDDWNDAHTNKSPLSTVESSFNLIWAYFHGESPQKTQETMQEHIRLNAAIHTPHANSCTHTHTQSMKNGVHLYAAVAVVGHSDQQALLDDRIQKRQEDLCSYLHQREGDGSSASLVGLCRLPGHVVR